MPARCTLSRRCCIARAGAAHAGMKRSLLRSRIAFVRRTSSGHPRAASLRSILCSVWQRHPRTHTIKLARLNLDSTSLPLPEQDLAFRLVVLLLANRCPATPSGRPFCPSYRAHASTWRELPALSSPKRTPEAPSRFDKQLSPSAERNSRASTVSFHLFTLAFSCTDRFLTRNNDAFAPSSIRTFPATRLEIARESGLRSQDTGSSSSASKPENDDVYFEPALFLDRNTAANSV